MYRIPVKHQETLWFATEAWQKQLSRTPATVSIASLRECRNLFRSAHYYSRSKHRELNVLITGLLIQENYDWIFNDTLIKTNNLLEDLIKNGLESMALTVEVNLKTKTSTKYSSEIAAFDSAMMYVMDPTRNDDFEWIEWDKKFQKHVNPWNYSLKELLIMVVCCICQQKIPPTVEPSKQGYWKLAPLKWLLDGPDKSNFDMYCSPVVATSVAMSITQVTSIYLRKPDVLKQAHMYASKTNCFMHISRKLLESFERNSDWVKSM